MLRLLVLLLLLVNGGYYAWSQGLLAAWGLAPAPQSESQRLDRQIQPGALRILGPEEAKRVEATAVIAKPAECLQAGPLSDEEAQALRPLMAAWPAGSWSLDAVVEPARWIIYMGKYANRDALEKKKAELRGMGITFEPLLNASLEPGVSLGTYPSQAEAQQAMNSLAPRGVRTARVQLERSEQRGPLLKLPAVDDSLRPRLDELKSGLKGRSLTACR